MGHASPYFAYNFFAPTYWADHYWGGRLHVPTVPIGFDNPITRVVPLVDLVGAWEPVKWTDDTAGVWYATVPGALDVLLTGSVRYNGVSLSDRASLAALTSAGEGWYYDPTTKKVYVAFTDSAATPYNGQTQVFVVKRLANFGRDFNGLPYEPRLPDNAVPKMSFKVDARFGEGSTRLSSGMLNVINNDSALTLAVEGRIDWDAGWAQIYLAGDTKR